MQKSVCCLQSSGGSRLARQRQLIRTIRPCLTKEADRASLQNPPSLCNLPPLSFPRSTQTRHFVFTGPGTNSPMSKGRGNAYEKPYGETSLARAGSPSPFQLAERHVSLTPTFFAQRCPADNINRVQYGYQAGRGRGPRQKAYHTDPDLKRRAKAVQPWGDGRPAEHLASQARIFKPGEGDDDETSPPSLQGSSAEAPHAVLL